MAKKRIIKDYDQLPEEVLQRLKLEYPQGFSDNLIKFVNAEGRNVSALPFETEEIYYLIRMTVDEAIQIIEEDEDYDEFGNLDEDFKADSGTISKEDQEDVESTYDEEEEGDGYRDPYADEADDDEEE